jgi:hypothetical protein
MGSNLVLGCVLISSSLIFVIFTTLWSRHLINLMADLNGNSHHKREGDSPDAP